MHEYPLTREVIRIAEEAAKSRGAKKITKIALVIGDLSGYAGDSVHMYFDEISKGTMCGGAKLVIRRIKPRLVCVKCGEKYELAPFVFECPSCGGEPRLAKEGSEFYIDYIETI